MPYVPHKKGTLLIPSGEGSHLFAVITDVCASGNHLLVTFSTVRENRAHDATCIVEAGEHAFLRNKSFISYRHTQVMDAARIGRLVDARTYTAKDDITDALLERLRAGVATSDYTPRFAIDYFNGL